MIPEALISLAGSPYLVVQQMAAFQVAAIDHQLRRSVQPVEVHDEPVLLGFAVDPDFFHFDARG